MAKTIDHVAYLSQEIGPRPAGTEEEQQAALYITEQLQKDAGLSTTIEDFTGVSSSESTFVILSAVSAVLAVASLFLSVLAVPAIIVTIVAAVLTVLERFGRPVISGLLSRGVSQNVVAQYKPAYSEDGPGLRRRKVVLVAHYDSGKVRMEMGRSLAGVQPILGWAAFGAMIALPLFLIIRYVGFIHADGALAVVLNVIMVIIALLALIPAFLAIAHKAAPYNEAANCNASGVAVMLDVASRIGQGRMSEAELHAADDPTIHGERAARAEGVVPEGAQLVYETTLPQEPEMAEASEAERLVAAKAAIAAMTGKPVNMHPARDISSNLVKVKEPPIGTPTEAQMQEVRDETREAFAAVPESTVQQAVENAEAREAGEGAFAAPQGAPASVAAPVAAAAVSAAAASVPSSVPSWYVEAQKKAKRPADTPTSIHRSRYASALDAAEAEGSRWFAAVEQISEPSELSNQLRQLQEGIKEVKAPRYDRSVSDMPVAVEETAAEQAAPVADAVAVLPESAASAPEPVPAPEADAAPLPADGSTQAFVPVAVDVAELRATAAQAAAAERAAASEPASDAVSAASQRRAARVRETREQLPEQNPAADPQPASAASVPIDAIPLFSSSESAQLAEDAVSGEVALPDLGENAPQVAPVAETAKQRAPLADAATSGKNAAKSLLSMLPSLSGAFDAVKQDSPASSTRPAGGASKQHDRVGMRTTLPSLSGSITRQGSLDPADADREDGAIPHAAGSAGMTGAFAPVGEELLKDVDPDDIFVDDADDSVYEENFTETGAFAGPGYVEMPSSRIGGFFGRFKRRKDKGQADRHETSAQEWLDVDEDFDAREVGKARGSWESFREEASDAPASRGNAKPQQQAWDNDYDDAADDDQAAWSDGDGWDSWDDHAADGDASWGDDGWDDGWSEDEQPSRRDDEDDRKRSKRRRWHGGAFSRLRNLRGRSGADADAAEDPAADAADEDASARRASRRAQRRTPREDAAIDRELEQIYRFRNPDIATEVWFVALGSELSCHSGMKAFLAEHESDLRGAIVIELEGLGAGEMSLIEKEGTFCKRAVSSRMGRYVTKASKESGVSVQKASIPWSDSTTAYALERGVQAMHLAGMEGSKSALASEADDVVGNVDEEKLERASDFVIALLKNI